jgi:hypothetical protein
MLPAAFFVNALESAQLIASSCASKSVVSGTLFAVYERFGLILFAIYHPVTVRVADWLVTVVAPVADAAALYRVPLFAVVRPVSDKLLLVALLTFAQVVPASTLDCHW